MLNPQKIKAVLFDMDGVLVETEHYHYESWKQTLAGVGIDLDQRKYERYCQAQGREQALAHFLPHASTPEIRRLAQKKGDYYQFLLDTKGLRLFDDAKQLLQRLQDQSVISVIASSSRQADSVITQTGYRHYFHFVLGGGDVIRNKPFPDLFQAAQQKLNLPVQQLVVIEDSLSGILAARLAGIDVYALDRHQEFANLEERIAKLLHKKKALFHDEELHRFRQSKTFVIQSLDEIFR